MAEIGPNGASDSEWSDLSEFSDLPRAGSRHSYSKWSNLPGTASRDSYDNQDYLDRAGYQHQHGDAGGCQSAGEPKLARKHETANKASRCTSDAKQRALVLLVDLTRSLRFEDGRNRVICFASRDGPYRFSSRPRFRAWLHHSTRVERANRHLYKQLKVLRDVDLSEDQRALRDVILDRMKDDRVAVHDIFQLAKLMKVALIGNDQQRGETHALQTLKFIALKASKVNPDDAIARSEEKKSDTTFVKKSCFNKSDRKNAGHSLAIILQRLDRRVEEMSAQDGGAARELWKQTIAKLERGDATAADFTRLYDAIEGRESRLRSVVDDAVKLLRHLSWHYRKHEPKGNDRLVCPNLHMDHVNLEGFFGTTKSDALTFFRSDAVRANKRLYGELNTALQLVRMSPDERKIVNKILDRMKNNKGEVLDVYQLARLMEELNKIDGDKAWGCDLAYATLESMADQLSEQINKGELNLNDVLNWSEHEGCIEFTTRSQSSNSGRKRAGQHMALAFKRLESRVAHGRLRANAAAYREFQHLIGKLERGEMAAGDVVRLKQVVDHVQYPEKHARYVSNRLSELERGLGRGMTVTWSEEKSDFVVCDRQSTTIEGGRKAAAKLLQLVESAISAEAANRSSRYLAEIKEAIAIRHPQPRHIAFLRELVERELNPVGCALSELDRFSTAVLNKIGSYGDESYRLITAHEFIGERGDTMIVHGALGRKRAGTSSPPLAKGIPDEYVQTGKHIAWRFRILAYLFEPDEPARKDFDELVGNIERGNGRLWNIVQLQELVDKKTAANRLKDTTRINNQVDRAIGAPPLTDRKNSAALTDDVVTTSGDMAKTSKAGLKEKVINSENGDKHARVVSDQLHVLEQALGPGKAVTWNKEENALIVTNRDSTTEAGRREA